MSMFYPFVFKLKNINFLRRAHVRTKCFLVHNSLIWSSTATHPRTGVSVPQSTLHFPTRVYHGGIMPQLSKQSLVETLQITLLCKTDEIRLNISSLQTYGRYTCLDTEHYRRAGLYRLRAYSRLLHKRLRAQVYAFPPSEHQILVKKEKKKQ